MILYIGLLILLGILIWISMKKQPKVVYIKAHSPEYRYPTKCFDCIHQRSQEHWNRSYGYGLVSY